MKVTVMNIPRRLDNTLKHFVLEALNQQRSPKAGYHNSILVVELVHMGFILLYFTFLLILLTYFTYLKKQKKTDLGGIDTTPIA
jgi:hypothetical protein